MLSHKLYYQLKPLIPRWLQIQVRHQIIHRKRAKYSDIWPIDERAGKQPEGWTGWPEGKRFALVMTHDVETAKGQERCIELAILEENLGFRSSFNFVAEEYTVSTVLLNYLVEHGFEIGVHGLTHNGNLFRSKKIFRKQALQINYYLKEWRSVGFRSPSMYHNLEWIHDLDIEYDASTFDTDPFEPQPDGVGTIFPFWVAATRNPEPEFDCSEAGTHNSKPETVLRKGFIELPYTLPQDFTLFVLMKEKNIDIWKKKLDWIVENGGMGLLNSHPDYMKFDGKKLGIKDYPVEYYVELLNYVKTKYKDQYWIVLPREVARFWKKNFQPTENEVI